MSIIADVIFVLLFSFLSLIFTHMVTILFSLNCLTMDLDDGVLFFDGAKSAVGLAVQGKK